MVDDNLVLRKADVVDRRRVLVHQTRRGGALYRQIRERLNKSEQLAALCASTALTPEQLTDLLNALQAPARPADLRA
jgi:DNA-binding MarR family transcriptional regulator